MANITFDEVKQVLSIAHYACDVSDDIVLYHENCEALRSRDFDRIRVQLGKSVKKYAVAIKMLSLFTNVTLVQYSEVTYEIAFLSLNYLTEKMPVYALCNKLGEQAFEFLIKKCVEQLDRLSSSHQQKEN
jgi:hypothetical protein